MKKYIYSNNSESEFDENTSELAVWRHPLVISAITATFLIFGTFLFLDYRTVRVNYIRADDVSESAKKNSDQRTQHCSSGSQNLKQGDSLTTIAFADRPEIIDDKKINVLQNFGHCRESILNKTSVGKQNGTSLYNVLDFTLTLIKAKRLKGDQNPFVVSISLEDAEPGPNQPRLGKKGFVKIDSLIKSIINQNASVAIIGTKSILQTSLHKNSGSDSRLQICTATNTKHCVDEAFQEARQIGLKK